MSGGSAYVNTNREEAERGVEAELTQYTFPTTHPRERFLGPWEITVAGGE